MTSTYTPNKNIQQPGNGDYNGDWNVPVNANFGLIDTAFGGLTSINAVGASGVVALTVAQYTPPIWDFAGALTSNVNYQLPAGVGGRWTVYNGTSGAYTITISSATGGGGSVVIPQGQRSTIYCDGTNVGADFSFGGIIGAPTTFTGYGITGGTLQNLTIAATSGWSGLSINNIGGGTQSVVNFETGGSTVWTMGLGGDEQTFYLGNTSYNIITSAGNYLYLGANQGLIIPPGGGGTFNGNVSMPSFTITSDARLKSDIAPLDLDLAGALIDRSNTYAYLKGGRWEWGMLAQEIREFAPGAVVEGGSGMLELNYMLYIPALVATVRDLRARVAALEAAR